MEYTHITACVPEGEHFDATAVNEGVWLTEKHLQSIESFMAHQATAASSFETQISEKDTAIAEAKKEASDAVAGQEVLQTKINELNTEIETLKKKPASDFTNTAKEKDENGGEVKTVDPVTEEANKKRVAMGLKPIA